MNEKHPALQVLLDEDWSDPKWFHGLPGVLWLRLSRSDLVTRIRDAWSGGSLTEQMVRDFVDHLLGTIKPDETFHHVESLSAIAVAFVDVEGDFADSFLDDLAKCEHTILYYCAYVAHKCIQEKAARHSSTSESCGSGSEAEPSI